MENHRLVAAVGQLRLCRRGGIVISLVVLLTALARDVARGEDAGAAPEVAAAQHVAMAADAQIRMLVTIARFTSWPPEARINGEPLILGLVGQHGFGHQLRDLEHVTIAGRPIEIRFFANAGEMDRCHVLYVSGSEAGALAEILARVQGRPVLTLSDVAGFARAGGMFEFVREGHQLRFISNPPAIAAAGLRMNRGVFRHGSTVAEGGGAAP